MQLSHIRVNLIYCDRHTEEAGNGMRIVAVMSILCCQCLAQDRTYRLLLPSQRDPAVDFAFNRKTKYTSIYPAKVKGERIT